MKPSEAIKRLTKYRDNASMDLTYAQVQGVIEFIERLKGDRWISVDTANV